MRRSFLGILAILFIALLSAVAYRTVSAARELRALTQTSGPKGPFTDYRMEKPGNVHHISATDLPPPYATSAVDNSARIASRPSNAWPQAPAGFKVELYAPNLRNPRLIRTAPNGDLFLAECGPNHGNVCEWTDAPFRYRFLSSRPGSPICLCRQHQFRCAFCVPKW